MARWEHEGACRAELQGCSGGGGEAEQSEWMLASQNPKFIIEGAAKCFTFGNQEGVVNSPRTRKDSRGQRGSVGEAYMLREIKQKTVGYTFETLN